MEFETYVASGVWVEEEGEGMDMKKEMAAIRSIRRALDKLGTNQETQLRVLSYVRAVVEAEAGPKCLSNGPFIEASGLR